MKSLAVTRGYFLFVLSIDAFGFVVYSTVCRSLAGFKDCSPVNQPLLKRVFTKMEEFGFPKEENLCILDQNQQVGQQYIDLVATLASVHVYIVLVL